MLAPYSTPASGFMSLEPIADLGEDAVVALWRAGVRRGSPPARAEGRALLINAPSGPKAVRLSRSSLQEARREAVKALPYGEVILLEATARARCTLFRRVEVIEAFRQGDEPAHAELVGSSGLIIKKALSPADPVDNRIISERLASQLQHAERKVFKPMLDDYLKKRKIDWGSLDSRGISRELNAVRTDMHKMMGGAATKAMPTWKTSIETTLKGVHKATRQAIRDNFLPSVGISLDQPDLRAIQAVADQSGWWMRDAAGRRSTTLTNQGRAIVQQGLKDGLGRNEIGRALQRGLPQAYQRMGQHYFNTVAAAAVNRGRSWSEVSGYIEVGIEQLEVMAVIDERTTEICRCLDGTIVETRVVSQQLVGAMNVADPEDIRTAAPFLKEVVNPNTGVKSIVSAGSGAKIADVVRSGYGRADDRGQFNSYLQNKDLAQQNIGVPPYHHLCRSWTVPISSTVSVPRGQVPRAMGPGTPPRIGGPPKPPKAPKRPKPLTPLPSTPQTGLAPSRPIQGVPRGTPSNPALVGREPDPDLYPFPADFLEAQAPPGMVSQLRSGRTTLKQGDVALFRPYQTDAATARIRASSKSWMRVSEPPGGYARLVREGRLYDNISKQLKVVTNDVGVALNVKVANSELMREVVLAEAKVAGGVRVYNVRELQLNKQRFLRFDHNKKRAAKSGLDKLRRAKTPKDIEAAFQQLEKKGFMRRSDKPDLWLGGSSPQPLARPKPKPRVEPKPKPKPYEPTVRPKPKPTTTEITPTGRVVAPKPKPRSPAVSPAETKPGLPPGVKAKDYSEYGLVEGEHLIKQVSKRIEIETAKLEEYMAAQRVKMGRELTRKEKGKAIKSYFREQLGKDATLADAQLIRRQTRRLSRRDADAARNRAYHEVRSDKHPSLRDYVKPAEFEIIEGQESVKLWQNALEFYSPRVQAALLEQKLPTIVTRRVAATRNAGATNFGSGGLIQIAGKTIRQMEHLAKHEITHSIDMLGRSNEAARIARSRWAHAKQPQGDDFRFLKGKWGDKYCGRVYKSGDTEINTVMAEAFSAGKETTLGKLYESNPEHVGFYHAYVRGAFL